MKNIFLLVIFSLLMIMYIILDTVFNEQIWEANTDLTTKLQEHQFKGELSMFTFFSLIIYAPLILGGLAYIFLSCKLNALLYLCNICTTTAANAFLKSIYHQPRPYMIEESIHAYSCEKDFGKPSGHAMVSIMQVFLFPYLIVPTLYKFKNKTPIYLAIQIFIIISMIITVFMTGLSRVYLGVHSLGQVILGWAYGSYYLFFYILVGHKYIKKQLFSFFIIFSLLLSTIDSFRNDQTSFSNILKVDLLLEIVFVCINILLLELNIHVLNDKNQIDLYLYKINQCLNQPIGTTTSSNQSILFNSTFEQTLMTGIVTGSMIGSKFNPLFTGLFIIKGSYDENQFSKFYSELQNCRKIIRILILIVPIGVVFLVFLIKLDNILILGLCIRYPVYILAGIYLICLYNYILDYFKLKVPGDFMYILTKDAFHEKIPQENV